MNIKEIEELIRFVSRFNIKEVEVETNEIRLVIKTTKGSEGGNVEATVVNNIPAIQQAPVASEVKPVSESSPEEKKMVSDKSITINSPMIGTFYRASGPDKPPFVNVGDKIEKGKVICIIEAMKLFNEIESEFSGTVVKVMVNDASPVEYGQPLFNIESQ
jgi:acetyl-CoA carboxylase biotin carboxyl carrier protein